MAYTTIKKPSDYFNTVLYSGNSTTGHAITGVGFQPDWVWTKGRSDADPNYVHDVVRTVSNRLNTAATTGDAAGLLSSFDSDGFTISSTGNGNNGTGHTYVAWNWLASNSTASNTDGSITSTVSANTTSGFSIVSYTGNGTAGATIGHGLSSTPKVVIIKGLGTTYNWIFGHNSLSANWTNYLTLSTTDASSAATNIFNDTAPTSSVFSIGNALGVNTNSSDYIAYCFAEKKGFSKFGSYTGNGNADGTFVYTGFKPAFIIVKRTDNVNNWTMYDNKRANSFNEITHTLIANASDAEATSTTDDDCDFLSNGVKMRCSNNGSNGSGATYIYMAFAEEPLVGDNPATAR